jgi:hypothetical protein
MLDNHLQQLTVFIWVIDINLISNKHIQFDLFIEKDGKVISPFHDVPLYAEGNKDKSVVNMVVEIPRWTNAKVEVREYDHYYIRKRHLQLDFSHRLLLEKNIIL